MQMLGGKSGGSVAMESDGGGKASSTSRSPAPASPGGSGFDDFADDIPF
jgi:hypothetical protein